MFTTKKGKFAEKVINNLECDLKLKWIEDT